MLEDRKIIIMKNSRKILVQKMNIEQCIVEKMKLKLFPESLSNLKTLFSKNFQN
jgi:hypothetical protein